MDRLGLGYDALSSLNPELIYCAISGYGQTGPYRDRAGHDLNYQALAGVLGQTGPAEAEPTLPAVQVADIGGGALWALVGILSALHQRTQTGRGQLVDISMTEGCLSFLHMTLASYLGGGASPPARGKDTLTGGEEKTMMKLIVDRASDKVVGHHMVGPAAGADSWSSEKCNYRKLDTQINMTGPGGSGGVRSANPGRHTRMATGLWGTFTHFGLV